MTRELAEEVIEKAPPRCPDRQAVDDDPEQLHEYLATLNENGKAECLGTNSPACKKCLIRVPSYRVNMGKLGTFRLPVSAVEYIPAPKKP